MTKSSPNDSLTRLVRQLESLSQVPLPNDLKNRLTQALDDAKTLETSLADNKEQGRLAALYEVSQSIGSSLRVQDVLEKVMDAVITLTDADRGFLMLLNPDTGELELEAARNIERETLQNEDMKVSRTVLRAALDQKETILATNAQQDPRFSKRESVILFALRSIMCAPMFARGEPLGVIYVDNPFKTGVFDEDDVTLLNTFAAQAAITINNAQLYTKTDESLAAKVNELEMLAQIDQELSDTLEQETIADILVKWVQQGTNAKNAWVALSNLDNPILNVITGENAGQSVPSDDQPIASVLETQTALRTKDSPARHLYPLAHAEKTFGVLVIEGDAATLDQADEFLTRVCARASSAIENARLYQAVQQANLAKSKFVSMVSHELRLPMTSIKGYTDLLLKGLGGELSEMQGNFLDVIRSNVERMAVLVSDLSDISRIETNRLKLELASIPFMGYVEQVASSMRVRLEEKSQTITREAQENLPNVHSDPNRTMQVLTNLLTNANKYTPDGGHIVLRASTRENMIYVEVEDNGIGISEADQAKLFTQFFRSEDNVVRDQQGWGLGLHVTKRLVNLMGGEIGVTSKLGKGSTFWFTLPIAPEPEQ